jgi:hypothetical protein
MINTDRDRLFQELELPKDYFEPAQTRMERGIRRLLIIGFALVLALEAWLLVQAVLAA